MKRLALFPFLLFTMLSPQLDGQALSDYRWKSRLVVVFTPKSDEPLFEEQVSLLQEEVAAFKERRVVFIWINSEDKHENDGLFLDESLAGEYYKRFNPKAEQVELLLIGLDGGQKFRARNKLTQPTVLLELIDGMPMRRQEILRGKGGGQ